MPLVLRDQSAAPNLRGTFPGVFALANGLRRNGMLDPADARWLLRANEQATAQDRDPSTVDLDCYDPTLHPGARSWFRADATTLLAMCVGYLDLRDRYRVPGSSFAPPHRCASHTRTRYRSSRPRWTSPTTGQSDRPSSRSSTGGVPGCSPYRLLGVSVSDFDVEPRIGSRFGVVVLGIASAIAGVLAIIGWPLPVISSTHGRGQHAWARAIRGVQDWLAHDGWRMSGASWIYGALAVVAAAAVVVLLHPSWSGRRALLIVVVPAGALLVGGPVLQWVLGAPWSNYGSGSAGGTGVGIISTVVCGAALMGFRRAARRKTKRDKDQGTIAH